MSEMNQEMAATQELYNRIIHNSLKGLHLYVRDSNLPEVCVKQYETGVIVLEPGYTDVSSHVGGMTTADRFSILSNHMQKVSFSPDSDRLGWYRAGTNARFKVLDVYEIQGKRQILLLHLPDNDYWAMFQSITVQEERNIVSAARKDFEKLVSEKAVPALQQQDWLDRCKKPVGMDEAGNLYELDPTLPSQMLPVNGPGFRAFYKQFFYLSCREWLEANMPDKIGSIETGVIAYGVINAEGNLAFVPVRFACLEDHQLRIRPIPNWTICEILYTDVENNRFLGLEKVDMNLSVFNSQEEAILAIYASKDTKVSQLRELEFLDAFRSSSRPDEIYIYLERLVDGKKQQQLLWGKCTDFTGSDLYAVLVEKPDAIFGVQQGDTVSVLPRKSADGKLFCVAEV